MERGEGVALGWVVSQRETKVSYQVGYDYGERQIM